MTAVPGLNLKLLTLHERQGAEKHAKTMKLEKSKTLDKKPEP